MMEKYIISKKLQKRNSFFEKLLLLFVLSMWKLTLGYDTYVTIWSLIKTLAHRY